MSKINEPENEECHGDCGDCHGGTGAEMTTDGSGLCIECRKSADLPEEEEEHYCDDCDHSHAEGDACDASEDGGD